MFNLYKPQGFSVFATLFFAFLLSNPSQYFAQGFQSITNLDNLPVTAVTGEKPQSKVWTYAGKWWMVMPNSSGTQIWRLDGITWTSVLNIDASTVTYADCKVVGNVTHILLYKGTNSSLVSVEYVPASITYQLWTTRSSPVPITLDPGVETATIDIDGNGRMWLASPGTTSMYVRWSDSPYSSWSSPITVTTGVKEDDICAVTAFDGKIGVLWSNQNTERFGFRYHVDGDDPAIWSADEVPASQSALNNVGAGMADDHINLAVASDGTIYAAIKTSYNDGFTGNPYVQIAMLIRRPSSNTWDDLYEVSNGGTRPIVILNEALGKIKFIYGSLYKESPTSSISFSAENTLINSGPYHNPTSTKQNYTGEIVIMASDPSTLVGVIARDFNDDIESSGSGYTLDFDGIDDYVDCGNNSSVQITGTAITMEAWIKPTLVGTMSIIKKCDGIGVGTGYELYCDADGFVYCRFNGHNASRSWSTSSYPITGEWVHVAATYDGVNTDMYINGVLEGTTAYTEAIVNSTNILEIANDPSTAVSFFQGSIDEVRLWNITRTQEQIRENMCKKLAGSETGLVGYWGFNETSGTSMHDETTNNNYGAMINMEPANDHVWSGAALGNASVFDYDGTGGFAQTLSHIDGDQITATTTLGTITGLQIYRVDDNAIRTGSTVPTGYSVDPLRYWGVKVIGTGSPEYTIVYNYSGHPGLGTEADLRIVRRDNISDASWEDVGVLPNVGLHTLTIAGESGTEYALASTSAPLPVELASFSANLTSGIVTLKWQTKTEVDNYGFEVERSVNKNEWRKIGFVEGHGNSNSPKNYFFTDKNPFGGSNFQYRLKQVDTDGKYAYSDVVEVSLIPDKYSLDQNYPNPFNPTTTIRFSLKDDNIVNISMFSILGEKVATLIDNKLEKGYHEITLDASSLASGVYIYKLTIGKNGGDFTGIKKMVVIK